MLLKKEFTSHIKSAIILLIIVSILMLAELSEFKVIDGESSYQALIDSLPNVIKSMFGFSGFGIDKISGIYAVMMLYIAIPFIFYSANLGHKVTAKTPNNKHDFIYNTYSRKRIYIKKIIANLLVITGICVLNLILNIITLKTYKETHFLYVILVNINLWLTCLLFFTISIFITSILKRNSLATTINAIIIILLYFLNVITSLLDKLNFLKYINPLYLYCSTNLINNNDYNYIYMGTCILLSIGLLFLSYLTFKRKDL